MAKKIARLPKSLLLAKEARKIEKLFKSNPIAGDAKHGVSLSDKVALLLFQSNQLFEPREEAKEFIKEIALLRKENADLNGEKLRADRLQKEVYKLCGKISKAYRFRVVSPANEHERADRADWLTIDPETGRIISYQDAVWAFGDSDD